MFKEKFAKLLKKEKAIDNTKDIEMAQKVHQGLLQVDIPNIPTLKITAHSKPATKIGGDFYNFMLKNKVILTEKEKQTGIIEYTSQNNEYLTIVIGDVAGHGIASALVMALCSGLITKNTQQTKSISEILRKTNNDLYTYISNTDISYVTTLIGKIDIANKSLTISNGGHCPLIHQRDTHIKHYNTEGTVLGLYKNEIYHEKSIDLKKGDRLFFYTDGITDAKNNENKFLDIEGLENIILKNKSQTIQETSDMIFKNINDFQTHTQDDQTLVTIEI